MKKKMIGVLAILICCSLFASPNRKTDCGTPCPFKTNAVVSEAPLDKAATAKVADDDLELLPMHQLVNTLL